MEISASLPNTLRQSRSTLVRRVSRLIKIAFLIAGVALNLTVCVYMIAGTGLLALQGHYYETLSPGALKIFLSLMMAESLILASRFKGGGDSAGYGWHLSMIALVRFLWMLLGLFLLEFVSDRALEFSNADRRALMAFSWLILFSNMFLFSLENYIFLESASTRRSLPGDPDG